MKLGNWHKCLKLHIYSLSTPRGRNCAYFRSMGTGFPDIGRFSKLPYLGAKLGHCQKLHIYSISTPEVQNGVYFRFTGNGFWDTSWFSKLPHLGMQLGHWLKCREHFCTYSLFLLQGVKIELIFGLLAAISKMWADFQNCLISAWNLVKFQQVAHIVSLYPKGVEIGLIFSQRTAVFEILADFQTCHIWAWNLNIGQCARSCTYTLFLPQEVETELIFALQAAASKIRTDFQNCHIWA